MANRPSHATQERILAFVSSKPNREVARSSTVETCTCWISKRLAVPEKIVIAELEAMERDGKVKLARMAGGRGIKQIQVVHGVEPEPWAVAQVEAAEQESEASAIPANIDYRQLADNVLLAALEVLGSFDDHKSAQKVKDDEIANLTEANAQIRSELSHIKAERDAATRARKVAEQVAHDEKNKADEARADLAEREGDIEGLIIKVERLQRAVRDASMGADLLNELPPDDRQMVSAALSRLLEDQR